MTGKVVLAAVISTVITVSSLIKFTLWSSKKGKDFSFLKQILFFGLIVVLIAGLAQIKNPGPIPVAVNTWVGTVIFLGYIVCDTQKLLKHGGRGDEEDDELVGTSLDLHVDISSIFFRELKIIQIFFN
ncbi:hypothetical protein Q3G72_035136 [Acer saccharum]|nr:hypothetical protein Q3G72_035136 [Acer saccharum]